MSTYSFSSEDSTEHRPIEDSLVPTSANDQNLDFSLQSLEVNSTQTQRPAYFYVLVCDFFILSICYVNTFIQLEGRVLRLHADYLSRCSLVLDGMFGLPASGAGAGSCVDKPLVLDSYAPPEQWKAFISFIYPQQ